MKRGLLAIAILSSVSFPVLAAEVSQLSIDSTATLRNRGLFVDVSGTVQCTAGSTGFIDVFLRQVVSRRDINSGGGGTGITCTGSTQPWTVTVEAFETAFKKGSAFARASAFVCDEFECDSISTEANIRIK
jgi:hypothetical protein